MAGQGDVNAVTGLKVAFIAWNKVKSKSISERAKDLSDGQPILNLQMWR